MSLINRCSKRRLKLLARNALHSLRHLPDCKLQEAHDIKNIVFVCKGNICRSVFAEFAMKAEFLSQVLSVDSCGLETEGGVPPPPLAQEAAVRFGIDLSHHLSKKVSSEVIDRADLILAMELQQYRCLVRDYPSRKGNIRLLRKLAAFPESIFCNIDDPYGQSKETFEQCFRQILRAIRMIDVRFNLLK